MLQKGIIMITIGRVVVVEKNKDGKIELTKDELQKLLDDAYNQGHADGSKKYDTITYPSPSWTYTTPSGTAIPLNKYDITL
jgi:hypothetical protein